MSLRAAVIIIKNEKILLMHRRKNSLEYFTVPGGTIEEGETSQLAAVREIREETGLNVEIGELFFEFDGARGHEYFFMAKNISGQEKLGGPESERSCEENLYELSWVSFDELPGTDLKPQEVKDEITGYFLK
ncbi:MAG: NUDIX domain-containing protein [Candidatus Moraniibacteriota bacterium]